MDRELRVLERRAYADPDDLIAAQASRFNKLRNGVLRYGMTTMSPWYAPTTIHAGYPMRLMDGSIAVRSYCVPLQLRFGYRQPYVAKDPDSINCPECLDSECWKREHTHH